MSATFTVFAGVGGIAGGFLIGVLIVLLCTPKQGINVERQASRNKGENIMSTEKGETLLYVDDDIDPKANAVRDSVAEMPENLNGESYQEGSLPSREVGSYFENKAGSKGKFPNLPLRITKKKQRVAASYAEY